MTSERIETWRMCQEANLYLLSSLTPAQLDESYSKRTRTVADQFRHMHSVRLRWLEHAAPACIGTAKKLERDAKTSKSILKKALAASSKAIERYILQCEQSGEIKKWHGSPTSFLGYLISHEAHHRGLVLVSLRLSGHKVPQEVIYGIWDWGKLSSWRARKRTTPKATKK